MVSTSIPAPASLQEALALVGELLAEKRRLECKRPVKDMVPIVGGYERIAGF